MRRRLGGSEWSLGLSAGSFWHPRSLPVTRLKKKRARQRSAPGRHYFGAPAVAARITFAISAGCEICGVCPADKLTT